MLQTSMSKYLYKTKICSFILVGSNIVYFQYNPNVFVWKVPDEVCCKLIC